MVNPLESINPEAAHLRAGIGARYDMGRSRLESLPLEAHAEYVAPADRVCPFEILARQDRSRVARAIPLRYGRMSASAFTFLRGSAAVMASDLAGEPRTDLWVQLCGDAHLGNFRWYHSPDRRLVFDLNDFDETLPGPFEWDVKRFATSVMVVARLNGLSEKKCRAVTYAAMRNYREFIYETSEISPLNLYYYRFESEAALEHIAQHGEKHRKQLEEVLGKAARKNSMHALKKLTRVIDGRRVIVPDPPLIVRVDEYFEAEAEAEAVACFEKYRESLSHDRRLLIDRFSLVDIAAKIVGVGSVGTRCLIMLLEAGDGTPLFLQFKQAVPSVLEPYLGASVYEQASQRVVEGQRLIQGTSDIFLGWSRWQNLEGQPIDFYFRQLSDGKGKIDVVDLEHDDLGAFAGICGKTLAFAHARSGDAMMIRGYIGDDETFDDVMVEFATRYADQTEQDHARLVEAIADGTIEAERDI
jgi:uncharacterized protein (DUF2252 family)